MIDVIENPRPMFENKDGVKFRFIEFMEPNNMKVWELEGVDYLGFNVEHCKFIDVFGIDKEVLAGLGVWDKITKEMQEKVIKQEVIDIEAKKRGRKSSEEMRDVPEELKCGMCSKVMKSSKAYIVSRAKAKDIEWKEYVENFYCQSCRPSKGRHKKVEDMPTENITSENNIG